ncbi:MAG: ABC transporter permease [Cellulomonas sp.]
MNGRHPATVGGSHGLATMLRILARIQLRGAVVWVLVLGASMIGTAASVAALYDTPAKIHTYAAAVTAGNALLAINGRVEGIDSLGGVVADEFGFMAAFLLPLLGVSLVARTTRREEESGRLELLLGGRIARHQPPLAALLVATATIALTGALFAAGLIGFGVPVAGSILYAESLTCLAFVFAGVAALLAQLSQHARGVYTWSLMVLAASYVLRGVGDVTGTWITWLSPLGWAEKAAPFGDQRWWTLAIPLAVGLTLGGVALRLAAGRDLGSALVRRGGGPQRASARLRNPIGLAVWIHRPGTLGWLAGGVLLAGMMGALSSQLVDAMAGNPALATAIGIAHSRPTDGLVAAVQLYLAVIAAGYVVQAIGTLRAEEADGRLETRLSGTLSRPRWLGSHALVVLAGLLAIVLGSSLVLGLTTALSVGDLGALGATMGAGLAYLPAELVLAGLALAVYGVRPRLFAVAWASYAVMTFIAFLGPGLKLHQWALDMSPTTHVGKPPAGTIQFGALTVMAGIAAALAAVGFTAFRRRGVPQG